MAGLTLGGGYGWLTPRHGLTIDNLLQATIVTSSGAAVTCSNKVNPDLFWAIRGGGCNFGVCTEFVFKLHPQRRTVYAGVLFYPALKEKLEELVKVTTEWWEKGKTEDAAMGQMVTMLPENMEDPRSPKHVRSIFSACLMYLLIALRSLRSESLSSIMALKQKEENISKHFSTSVSLNRSLVS